MLKPALPRRLAPAGDPGRLLGRGLGPVPLSAQAPNISGNRGKVILRGLTKIREDSRDHRAIS
jgi:hypothetical protein